jgi:hypothetical protein
MHRFVDYNEHGLIQCTSMFGFIQIVYLLMSQTRKLESGFHLCLGSCRVIFPCRNDRTPARPCFKAYRRHWRQQPQSQLRSRLVTTALPSTSGSEWLQPGRGRPGPSAAQLAAGGNDARAVMDEFRPAPMVGPVRSDPRKKDPARRVLHAPHVPPLAGRPSCRQIGPEL